ncbi:hypothetical protein BpOF4_03720 [Alkalihalophilus pseudofirmus OF4]|uniref:Uncharacterized protein n=1 Tax=Alkalihalophilus pseudofirmus (strain ATCC BAA-2126 / JCM 17055 / OF4) TaxID=398511 RepID=D3FX55_ALKPO|nr:hypothetical protein [Alkalihalophilus pseudofirmus]ADC48810.1 hypothetical protein BpOF4_03720 [Alkalihalophilus pseudofirmus OF4]
MKERKKIINLNKWPRSINHKKSMNQLIEERKQNREEKIKQIEKEANDLLKELED